MCCFKPTWSRPPDEGGVKFQTSRCPRFTPSLGVPGSAAKLEPFLEMNSPRGLSWVKGILVHPESFALTLVTEPRFSCTLQGNYLFFISLCRSRGVGSRVVQVEDGSGGWVLAFWTVRSVPATAGAASVEEHAWQGALSLLPGVEVTMLVILWNL